MEGWGDKSGVIELFAGVVWRGEEKNTEEWVIGYRKMRTVGIGKWYTLAVLVVKRKCCADPRIVLIPRGQHSRIKVDVTFV